MSKNWHTDEKYKISSVQYFYNHLALKACLIIVCLTLDDSNLLLEKKCIYEFFVEEDIVLYGNIYKKKLYQYLQLSRTW